MRNVFTSFFLFLESFIFFWLLFCLLVYFRGPLQLNPLCQSGNCLCPRLGEAGMGTRVSQFYSGDGFVPSGVTQRVHLCSGYFTGTSHSCSDEPLHLSLSRATLHLGLCFFPPVLGQLCGLRMFPMVSSEEPNPATLIAKAGGKMLFTCSDLPGPNPGPAPY